MYYLYTLSHNVAASCHIYNRSTVQKTSRYTNSFGTRTTLNKTEKVHIAIEILVPQSYTRIQINALLYSFKYIKLRWLVMYVMRLLRIYRYTRCSGKNII